jgi:site-specific recombinase XerD
VSPTHHSYVCEPEKKLPEHADGPIDQIHQRHLEAFLQARLQERAHTTVSKERDTVAKFFGWVVGQGHIAVSPAMNLPRIKTAGDLPPFREPA